MYESVHIHTLPKQQLLIMGVALIKIIFIGIVCLLVIGLFYSDEDETEPKIENDKASPETEGKPETGDKSETGEKLETREASDGCALLFGSFVLISLILSKGFCGDKAESTIEPQTEMAEKSNQEAKKAHEQMVKLAELNAKLLDLSNEQSQKLEEARSKLKALQESRGNISSPSAPVNDPNDDQTELILSALWLGFSFFLQRLFEKIFHDKGYALLTVCAAGFLLAFFTANYFLFGGSVTGGFMGYVGERT